VSAAVTVLPLNHPLRIAEEIATLDHISEGRLDSGSAAAAAWMGGKTGAPRRWWSS
jgi:alkanesulfonate monooxygenase SsuD/methylene tetrahydromethanopterin reductase-like flavin-dependent oxidoreductase (luciferase family)